MVLRPQRPTARPLRRGVIASCWLATGLLVVACSSGTPQASSPPPSSSGSSSTSSGPGPSSTTTTASPERSYPAGGPTDVIFPPSQPSYELLTGSSGCEELLGETQHWPRATVDGVPGVDDVEGVDTVPLYQAAAYACLGRWADARRAFAEIHTADPTFTNNGCVRRDLLAWLTTLVRESESDPAFAPVFVPSSAPSPCPPPDTEPSVDPGTSTSSTTSTSTTG